MRKKVMDRSKIAQFPNDTVAAAWILYVGRMSNTAALAVLIYEKFLILQEEIELVWCKRKSWITVFYFFNSWIAPLWLAFQLTIAALTSPSATTICIVTILGKHVVTLLMILSVQVAMQLRVWAIYERSRKILWFITILLCIECAAMVTLLAIMIANVKMLPIIFSPFGCAFETLPHYSSFFWVPAIIIEPILCGLVLRKALGLLRARSGLSALLARDRSGKRHVDGPSGNTDDLLVIPNSKFGVFLCTNSSDLENRVFAGLLSILVAWLIDPINIVYFYPWAIAFPSLLGCRLLLNIRRHFESGWRCGEIELSTYRTAQAQAGNDVPDDSNV